ncbi:hypothetical protein E2542_SST08084 [Spatholobus suberectus]|nr:hypothetical protein E2542_SST08084 [Spatholobus suberectus]
MLPSSLQSKPFHEQIPSESDCCDRFHHPLLIIAFASDGAGAGNGDSDGAGVGADAGTASNSNTIPIITIP